MMADTTMAAKQNSRNFNIAVKPRKGDALFWYNTDERGDGVDMTEHTGMPVYGWEKYGLNMWFCARRGVGSYSNSQLCAKKEANAEDMNEGGEELQFCAKKAENAKANAEGGESNVDRGPKRAGKRKKCLFGCFGGSVDIAQ